MSFPPRIVVRGKLQRESSETMFHLFERTIVVWIPDQVGDDNWVSDDTGYPEIFRNVNNAGKSYKLAYKFIAPPSIFLV